MMQIRKIDTPCSDARQVPQMMAAGGITYHKVECVDWKKSYPYCPSFEVAFAHDADNLYIHYKVTEQSVRGIAEKDQDNVWEDSCVEFFSQPNPSDGIYYNVECNCTGKILLAAGKTRENREPAPAEITSSIKRWASLGEKPFDERMGETSWEIALILPRTFYFKHRITSFDGMQIRGNVYKCGDKLTTPNFISLYPILTEKPDFHRPDFFQEIVLE